MGRLFEAEIRGLGRREDWDRGSKYEEEFPGTPYFATRPLHATPKALHTIILGIFDS